MTTTAADHGFMGQALVEAESALQTGDVPVGCVVVVGDSVIAAGRNRREAAADPTAHAEVEALRAAAQALGTWRVEGTLYVTHEPCVMCAGAIVNARVKRVVFGCDNPKAGGVRSLYEILSDSRLNHRVTDVVGGVRSEEAAELLRRFFQQLRTGPAYGEPG